MPTEELATYGKTGSRLQSHPCAHALPLLEVSSGSLGHGLGIASGIACGLGLRKVDRRAVALLSDGDCNEGSTWEAAMFAGARSLERLVAIVDHNGRQAVGTTRELMGDTPLEQKFASFGWACRVIDGHDQSAVLAALAAVPFAKDRPSAIIARTRAGAGVRSMEENQVWFYRRPSAADLRQALDEIGAPPLYEGKRG
jgi:transketolase